MGLAFTVGLVLGLLAHLPGVSSPDGSQAPAQRTRRHLRSLHNVVEDSAESLRDVYAGIKRHNSSETDVYLDTTGADSAAGLQAPVGGSLNGLQSQIKQTQAHIHALRQGVQGHGTEAETRSEGSKQDQLAALGSEVGRTATVRVYKHQTATKGQPKWKSSDSSQKQPSLEPDKKLPGEFSVLRNVLDGIYWRPSVEMMVPAGYGEQDVTSWKQKLEHNKVVRITEGCGRMQNRQVTLEDGSRACARYRLNTDQIQGEVFSYYLAKLLQVPNLPPSALAIPDTSKSTWAAVRDDVIAAQWNTHKALVLTPWQDDLHPAYIPRELRLASGRLYPSTDLLNDRDLTDLAELVQWSDLIILDYLTANVDRVVNNLFNKQWNPDMMDSPAHNLLRHTASNLLVFLDNESGLFHSYRLLDKYAGYHSDLLKALCIFRKSTADVIKRLHEHQSVGAELRELLVSQEPLVSYLPAMPDKNVKTLQSRVDDVYTQITYCERNFGTRT